MNNKEKMPAITDIHKILTNQEAVFQHIPSPRIQTPEMPSRPKFEPQPQLPHLPENGTRNAIALMDMDPTGPWASGHLDWAPLAGLTGTRPVVDHYSITKYSVPEWQKNNARVLQGDIFKDAKINDYHSKNKIIYAKGEASKNHRENTFHLKQRACDIFHWKSSLESAIERMAREIADLESERQRIMRTLHALRIPALISKECLELRTTRLETDLVHDPVEAELIKETSLINEIKQYLERLLEETEQQISSDKEAKRKAEFDWSDKMNAFDIESQNTEISNKSKTILHVPGAMRIPEGQSDVDIWNNFTKVNLSYLEETLRQSQNIRQVIDATLMNAARDILSQSDAVNNSLVVRISETDELRIRLDDQLEEVLKKIVEAERTSELLQDAIKVSEGYCSAAYTRTYNRNSCLRPNVENCRDPALWSLIDEAKALENGVTSLRTQWQNTQIILAELLKERAMIEKEIAVKRKTVIIDRDRCTTIRSFYTTVVELTGHHSS